MWQQLLRDLQAGSMKALARTISFVENEQEGYEDLLQALPTHHPTKIIGLTGPPGAGKSTLADALIGEMVQNGKKIAVLCIDPSSPFNMGAVLGDRIRMSDWYTHPQVFIRSCATRGAMGGLNSKIIEITEVIKAAHFDYIIVETVGVGQSEIEIAGLADATVVVMVPEGGDEVQTMKAGLMEIADIFVVNKSDRPDADTFIKNLKMMLAAAFSNHKNEVVIIKTVATQKLGIDELFGAINFYLQNHLVNEKKGWLLTEKSYQLIQQKKMTAISKEELYTQLQRQMHRDDFNLYTFVKSYE